jgi:anti-sigma regulatory factor (Ser/Thr protein kinase)
MGGPPRTFPQHPCCDTAVLLGSELVTNAVVHSASGLPSGTISIVVLQLTGAVRVEVIDPGPRPAPRW